VTATRLFPNYLGQDFVVVAVVSCNVVNVYAGSPPAFIGCGFGVGSLEGAAERRKQMTRWVGGVAKAICRRGRQFTLIDPTRR